VNCEPLKPDSSISVQRATAPQADAAFALIEEYYEAVGVVVRDDRAALERYLASADSPIWIATADAAPAGCVMLRPLPAIPHAAEVKRLYVRPAFRGLGLAHALMQAAEQHARAGALGGFTLTPRTTSTPPSISISAPDTSPVPATTTIPRPPSSSASAFRPYNRKLHHPLETCAVSLSISKGAPAQRQGKRCPASRLEIHV